MCCCVVCDCLIGVVIFALAVFTLFRLCWLRLFVCCVCLPDCVYGWLCWFAGGVFLFVFFFVCVCLLLSARVYYVIVLLC